jgi:glycerol-3-phosphate acyltransferase PlsY
VNPFSAYSLVCLGAYLLGAIPFGFLIARTRGIDIREHGSRNIGATNVFRVLGRTWGLLTFACDAGKGALAVVLARHFAGVLAIDGVLAGIAAALACLVGHSFPVWLRFKGGKGVASSLGVLLGLMPVASLIVLGIWGVVFRVSRYVSLASLVAAVTLPVVVFGLLETGRLEGMAHLYFAGVAALLVIWRHRENIGRLRAGTENRFGRK